MRYFPTPLTKIRALLAKPSSTLRLRVRKHMSFNLISSSCGGTLSLSELARASLGIENSSKFGHHTPCILDGLLL